MSSATDTAPEHGAAPAPVTALAWLWVAIPFGWGFYELVVKIPALFG